MLDLFKLFGIFFKLGCINFGGGYALLPLLQKELVEKRGWATEEEIADYYAIGQCTPGAIAVNVSTFIGYKLKGILGGIFATLGFITPAFIIIFIIATVLNQFSEYEAVQSAFKAIRVCVFVLVLSAVIKLAKKSIVDWITLIIAVVILFLAIFTPLPLYLYVIVAGVIGILVGFYRDKKKNKEEVEILNESTTEASNEMEDE
ncbi:MAG: chromate transporter [Erysipelotrichaceae bacterium]|nr:chromate transporter [Erysipelotrichaceae bacterium]